ncbi:MAG TPA: hypothetical protein VNC39_01695 [Acidocella sp.]|jgi:hypothetical protein|uniref:hypothetical protein n=1 Tax=Acidocella sp. TaxID=50710 RepID=UPI002B679EA4|nr:hypothetical protein [Acidocella sp.]HVE20664.1 hypothetical protein [Acidocella sp.]
MENYAYVLNGVVVVYPVPIQTGFTLAQCYHADYVANCVAVPAGVTPQPGWVATETGGVWSFAAPSSSPAPTLAQMQATQSALMQTACKAAIEGGFTSSALGTSNGYPSDQETQMNIALVAVSGGSLWCQPSSGGWVFTAHTAAQAQQVQKDLNTHIQTQQTTYAGLLSQVSEATTVGAVQAISWP